MTTLVPSVPDEEVLGPAPGERRSSFSGGVVPSWVTWLVIGLLLLAIVWGLFAIAP